MIYKLVPYRVPINASLLEQSAAQLLGEAGSAEKMRVALGWGPEHLPFIEAGLRSDPMAGKFQGMVKNCTWRRQLKEARIAKGFSSLISPRKGLRGWWQKTFKDPKEKALPVGCDVLDCIHQSTRYQLMVAVHDALLPMVSSAEPRKAAEDEVQDIPHPVAGMLENSDLAYAQKFDKFLGAKLTNIEPEFIVSGISGYICLYDKNRAVAYYYGQ